MKLSKRLRKIQSTVRNCWKPLSVTTMHVVMVVVIMTTDKQVKHIYASVDKAEDGTYTATIVCSNFDKISLGELFDVLEDEVSDTTYVDLPVISELQDPKFMEELNRRVASIKDGSTKTYSIDEVFDRLQKKFPDDKVEVSLNIKT